MCPNVIKGLLCQLYNIDQWHVTTGLFYGKVYGAIPKNKMFYDCNIKILIFLFFF